MSQLNTNTEGLQALLEIANALPDAIEIDTTLSQSGMAADAKAVGDAIVTHNTSATAHDDIRDLIEGLTTRLNTLADSDDTTLDQLSEIVSYIKNNKTLIEGVTSSKVNVTDIVNNLTSTATNKPLSAAQGKALKDLIDALDGSLATVATSGSYNDLSDKPTIPAAVTVDSALSSGSTNPVQNKVVNTALSGKAPTSHASSATTYGVSTASNYGHAKASSTTPKANGTAAVGSETSSFARGDHVHPVSNVAASKVTAGTLAGKVQANATAAATLGNAQVRDIIVSTTDLTPGTSTLATGTVYLVYE